MTDPSKIQSFLAKHKDRLPTDKMRLMQARLRSLQKAAVVPRPAVNTQRVPDSAVLQMLYAYKTQQLCRYLGSREYKDRYSEAGLPANWPKPIPFCSLAAAGRKYGYVKASAAPAVVTIPAATSILIHPTWYSDGTAIAWRTITGAGSGDAMTPSHVAAATDLADAAISGATPWRFQSPFRVLTDSSAWSGNERAVTGVAVGDVSLNVPNKYQMQGGWMSVQPNPAYNQTGAIRIACEHTCPRSIGRNSQEFHHRPQNQQSTMHNDMNVSFRVPMSAAGSALTFGEYVEDVAPMEAISGAGGKLEPFYIPSAAHEDWVYPSWTRNTTTAPIGDTVNIDSGHMPRNWLHLVQDGSAIVTNSHPTESFDVLVNGSCLFAFTIPVPGSGLNLDTIAAGIHQKARDLNPNRPYNTTSSAPPMVVRGPAGVKAASGLRGRTALPEPRSHEVQHAPETDLERGVQDAAGVGGIAVLAHQTGLVSKAKNALGLSGASTEAAAASDVSLGAKVLSEIEEGGAVVGSVVEDLLPFAAAL